MKKGKHMNNNSDIRPQLTKIAAKNNWIIWKLSEQEANLEDVFHQLTHEAK